MAVTGGPEPRRGPRRDPGRGTGRLPAAVARSLDAARVTDAGQRADVEHCRRLHALHGRTYYLATWLLPPDRRPWVWSLYGFFRTADELVDAVPTPAPEALRSYTAGVRAALTSGTSADPSVRALLAVLQRYDVEHALVESFLTSMEMDLEVTGYETYDDLLGYMEGSARSVGLMMLPVLGTASGVPLADAAPYAALLGEAFQLTNFVRDVGEDLDRGRVYLPAEDLATGGVTRADLEAGREGAPPSDRVVALLELEIERCMRLYRQAEPGIALLDPRTRPGVQVAATLYREILARVRAEGYPVLRRRVGVPWSRRAVVATGTVVAGAGAMITRRPGAPG